MKKTVLAMLAGAALAAAPALAQFEGEIDMKITAPGGTTGNGRMFVSKIGARTELDMQTQRMPMKMTTIMKFSNPDVVWLVNDTQKSYVEMDLKKMKENADKSPQKREPWTVKKLGRETVNAYSAEHVVAQRGKDASTTMEMWTTKDLAGLNYEAMRGLMSRGQGDEGLYPALRDAGADGFIVKMVTKDKAGNVQSTMELTKAEKRSVPASMLEIPPGYTKQEGMMGAAGMVSPEASEQMRKAMENMTPEQRKQIEEMMKRQQQQNH